MINTTIYTEPGKGVFLPDTKKKFLTIIKKLIRRGAEASYRMHKIPISIKQEDGKGPVVDITRYMQMLLLNLHWMNRLFWHVIISSIEKAI